MELTVVIPARDVAATLPQQLDALLAQEWEGDWEIVVLDNGSRDETPAIVEEYARTHPRVRLVRDADGAGVNYARNRGIDAANGEHVAICDGDDIVGPRWVAAMGDALREHDCVTGPIDVRRLNPAWLVRTRGEFPTDAPRSYYGIFPLAAGGNMGIRRATWEKVGRFREDVVGAVDDIELCLRLWRDGVAIGFAGDAVVSYRYRTEPRALWRQGRFYGKGKPLICKLLHEHDLPTPSRVAGWKSWALLLVWLPRLATLEGRAAWCWVAGSRVGQLEGCVHHRALWL